MIQPKRIQDQQRLIAYRKRIAEEKKQAYREKLANRYRNKLVYNATPVERRLRNELYMDGIPFEFQKVIPHNKTFFIIDFYFEHDNIKLAVELDGHYHTTKEGKIKDVKRSAKIRKKGIKMMRFPNGDVAKDPGYVIAAIKLKLGIFIHNQSKQ